MGAYNLLTTWKNNICHTSAAVESGVSQNICGEVDKGGRIRGPEADEEDVEKKKNHSGQGIGGLD